MGRVLVKANGSGFESQQSITFCPYGLAVSGRHTDNVKVMVQLHVWVRYEEIGRKVSVGIYAIYSIDNACLYVGQSSNLEGRFKKHLALLRNGRHSRKDFATWYNDSEDNSLDFRIMCHCKDDSEIKNRLEIFYFNMLQPRFYGKLPSTKDSFKHSNIARDNISQSMVSFHENLGTYSEVTCFCGNLFKTFKNRAKKYCSTNCKENAPYSEKSSLDYDTVVDLYSSGLSLQKVGEELGVSYRTIHKFMVKMNIPRRTQGNRNKLH